MNLISTKVENISDLMSIAIRAEREAVQRYSLLAEKMREGGNQSTAELFERMAIEEQEHEQLLLTWMKQEGIDENPDVAPVRWHDPNISTAYRDEARDPYQSSPYKALALAVHNEEIAFRFYTHVSANTDDKTIRKYAEILAQEELEHMALLRAERRRAYHAERNTNGSQLSLDPNAVHKEIDLLTVANYIDHFLIKEMAEITTHSSEINSLAKEIRLQIEINEKVLHDNALNNNELPGENITRNLEQIKPYSNEEKNNDTQDIKIQRLYSYCDRSFAFYSEIVENTADETVMLTAQKLSSSTLDRLETLEKLI